MADRRVLTNLRGLCTPDPARAWAVDRIPDAALALEGGRVAWMGRAADLPAHWNDAPKVDGGGAWATPGFVDPHTHLLFGGNRSGEFNRRLAGVSYQQIAAEGGGIRETVRATRAATVEELVTTGEARLQAFRQRGVVHLECKTGYGLELEAESRMTAAYAELKRRGWSLDVTLLPAHDIAPEFHGDAEANLRAVSEDWLPELVRRHPGVARFCDIFVETGVYTQEQGRRMFAAGKALGLIPRVHADELTWTGGAELAAEVGAASADHLMFCSEAGMKAMAAADVTPVLLPATTLFLGMRDWAPARKMIEAGCRVALATDFNPGSCPCVDPLTVLRLGCLQLRMTFEEAFTAMTLHAARSLRRDDLGHLHPGAKAEVLLWDVEELLELVYWVGEPYRPRFLNA
ncbi:imidazolonepropionase [Geothrix sp. PMB-07]|uniref:imidazolonepropionase n=1 Tax=Geothrix sp. PMB-07 TaxID=3068640 RepID=UPI0027414C92|nr:imidazolonepropionase [Geothrix sp. PMB-07]WLT30137.1 imidazolonepropionase [Geothrix sp. PMB-07]